jgi:hypothetical protein
VDNWTTKGGLSFWSGLDVVDNVVDGDDAGALC